LYFRRFDPKVRCPTKAEFPSYVQPTAAERFPLKHTVTADMVQTPSSVDSSRDSEYVWEVATLFPVQGDWSEAEYLDLTDGTKRQIEFSDGRLEFLAMPTEVHERLTRFLFLALYNFVEQAKLGEVYGSGIRLRVRAGKVRLPDVIFLHKEHFHLRHNRVWDGADLVMEVVNDDPKDRQRDYREKLADYAAAQVAEYWIVDPERRTVTVHQLRDGKFSVLGEFTAGSRACSAWLPGFEIDVGALLDVIKDVPE
jgi:Uma2 family endonuclease